MGSAVFNCLTWPLALLLFTLPHEGLPEPSSAICDQQAGTYPWLLDIRISESAFPRYISCKGISLSPSVLLLPEICYQLILNKQNPFFFKLAAHDSSVRGVNRVINSGCSIPNTGFLVLETDTLYPDDKEAVLEDSCYPEFSESTRDLQGDILIIRDEADIVSPIKIEPEQIVQTECAHKNGKELNCFVIQYFADKVNFGEPVVFVTTSKTYLIGFCIGIRNDQPLFTNLASQLEQVRGAINLSHHSFCRSLFHCYGEDNCQALEESRPQAALKATKSEEKPVFRTLQDELKFEEPKLDGHVVRTATWLVLVVSRIVAPQNIVSSADRWQLEKVKAQDQVGKCGGVMIKKGWILTTRECVLNSAGHPAKELAVYISSKARTEDGETMYHYKKAEWFCTSRFSELVLVKASDTYDISDDLDTVHIHRAPLAKAVTLWHVGWYTHEDSNYVLARSYNTMDSPECRGDDICVESRLPDTDSPCLPSYPGSFYIVASDGYYYRLVAMLGTRQPPCNGTMSRVARLTEERWINNVMGVGPSTSTCKVYGECREGEYCTPVSLETIMKRTKSRRIISHPHSPSPTTPTSNRPKKGPETSTEGDKSLTPPRKSKKLPKWAIILLVVFLFLSLILPVLGCLAVKMFVRNVDSDAPLMNENVFYPDPGYNPPVPHTPRVSKANA